MKKILFALLIFVSAAVSAQTLNPTNGTVSNKSYSPAQAVSTDFRSQFFDEGNFVMRDYQGVAEVFSYLNLSKYRAGHFPIYVHSGGTLNSNGTYTGGQTIVYYFKDGTANGDLVFWNDVQSVNGRKGIVVTRDADSLMTRPIDTTYTGPSAILAYDSPSQTFKTIPAPGGVYTNGIGISITGPVIAATNTSPIWNANQLRGRNISNTAPTVGQRLTWNGLEWAPSSAGGGDSGTFYKSGTNIDIIGDSIHLDDSIVLRRVTVSTPSGEDHYIDASEKTDNDWLTKLNVQNMFSEIEQPSFSLLIDSTLKWDSTQIERVLGVDTTKIYTGRKVDSLVALRDPLSIDTAKHVADSIEYTRVNGDKWKVKDSTGGIDPYFVDPGPILSTNPLAVARSVLIQAAIDAITVGGATGDLVRTSIAGLDVNDSFPTNKVYWLTDTDMEGPVVFTGKMSDGQAKDDGVLNFVTADSNRYTRVYDGKIDLRWAGLRPGTDGTTRTNNVLAWAKVKAVATDAQTIYEPPGDWYYNDSIGLFTAIQGKTYHVLSRGNSFFSSANGFVLYGKGPVSFDHSAGNITGPNAFIVSADSLLYEAYVGGVDGVGLDMINTYNGEVKFNEVSLFRVGVRQLGRADSIPTDGSQMMRITGNWVHHNRTNVFTTTQGDGGSLAPWATESVWNINQVGRGFGTTNLGGWYGWVMNRMPGSNSPDRLISGHHITAKIEGNKYGLVMGYAASNTFTIGVEDGANTYDFRINDTTCRDNVFIGADYFNDNMFVPGWGGLNTTIIGKPFWNAVGSSQGYMSMNATWIVAPGTVSHWSVPMVSFPGFTVWNRFAGEMTLDRPVNIFNSALLTDAYSRMTKTGAGGPTRYVGYAPQYALIDDAFEDGDTAQAITGMIRSTNSINKTVKIDARDLILGFLPYEIFVEKSGTGNLVIVRSDNGSSILTILGSAGSVKYSLRYRSSAWVATQMGGTGTGTGISNMYYGTSPTTMNTFTTGIGIVGNTAEFGFADGTDPGGIGPYEQYWKGLKKFDSLRTPRLDFRWDATNNPYPVQRYLNGIVEGVDGLPNPTATTQFTRMISSSHDTKDILFVLGARSRNSVWFGNNGQTFIFGNEKTSGLVFDFRKSTTFGSLTSGSGISIFSLNASGSPRLPLWAGASTRMVTVTNDGTLSFQAIPGVGGSDHFTNSGLNYYYNAAGGHGFGTSNTSAFGVMAGSTSAISAFKILPGLKPSADQFSIEHDPAGKLYNTDATNIRRRLAELPTTGNAGDVLTMTPDETDIMWQGPAHKLTFSNTASVPVSGTVTETSINSGTGSLAVESVPTGSVYRYKAYGSLGTSSSGTTLIFRASAGNSSPYATTITLPGSLSLASFILEFEITVNGSNAMGFIKITVLNGSAPIIAQSVVTGGSWTASGNTTATIQWGSSNVNNTLAVFGGNWERIRLQ